MNKTNRVQLHNEFYFIGACFYYAGFFGVENSPRPKDE